MVRSMNRAAGRIGTSPLRALARLVLGSAVAGIGLAALSSCAESAFYYPSREPFETPEGYRDVEFKTSDGVMLRGWFIPARVQASSVPGASSGAGHSAPAVLHVHGNAGNIAGHAAFSDFLADAGISVLVFDYRGYGRSEPARNLSRELLYRDTQAALEYLQSRPDVDSGRIGVYGVSLGGAFALNLAADRPEIRAVCTVSSFSTWQGAASDHAPVLGSMLIRSGLDPANAAARLGDRPYLIIHGARDSMIAPIHADRLEAAARAAGVRVEKYIVPEGDHNDAVFVEHRVRPLIAAFFAQNLERAEPDR